MQIGRRVLAAGAARRVRPGATFLTVLLIRVAIIGVLIAACGGAARPAPRWPDAPVALRDDGDRAQAIDQLWVMPLGPARDRARDQIAAATARRIADALAEDRPLDAATLLAQLTSLWEADPATVGRGLAAHVGLIRTLRGMFARSGALAPAVQTLVLLAELEPPERARHLAEIDEILAFADDLAIAENGPDAVRAQPIATLEPTALALPLPWLVDRYVDLLAERQRAIARLLADQGASMQLVRAHHDILSTSRRIAGALARGGRVSEIHRHLRPLTGIGIDRAVTLRAQIVAEHPTAEAYGELANELRVDERSADPAAALAVCLVGLARFPGDVGLLIAAADDARALGRVEQAIVLYEDGLRGSVEVDASAALRLGKLYGDRIARLASGGRPRAARGAWDDVLTFTSKQAKHQPHTVWQQTAAIAESALGRGLASQGLVRDAKRALVASLERAPSLEAYETLTTLELQTGRFAEAQRWAEAGLALLGEHTVGDRYRTAKLERLAGDALRGAGAPRRAAARYLDALRSWAAMGEDKDLPRAIASERRLELGRMMWRLGEPGRAVDEVMRAVELAPEAPAIIAGAVAFLLETGNFRDAVDAYHRGLGAELSDFYKVYMSLWLAAEARRRGETLDRLAAEYLATRRGDTWYELLARAATGRMSFAALRAAATTGPRQAELAFYGATLGFHPQAATAAGKRALLEQVVAAGVVLDAEYDLARLYLARP